MTTASVRPSLSRALRREIGRWFAELPHGRLRYACYFRVEFDGNRWATVQSRNVSAPLTHQQREAILKNLTDQIRRGPSGDMSVEGNVHVVAIHMHVWLAPEGPMDAFLLGEDFVSGGRGSSGQGSSGQGSSGQGSSGNRGSSGQGSSGQS